MKPNLFFRSSIVFALTSLLVACGGGDQRGENTSGRPFPLEGLWMSQAALTDFQTPGDLFCAAVERHPSRHGSAMWRYGIPGVRIMKITNGGDVFRWSPSLRLNDPGFRLRGYFVGRISADGVPTSAVFGTTVGEGMGTVRVIDNRRLAIIAGTNPFRVTETTADNRTVEVRDPDLDFVFERVTDEQARAYLSELKRCQPRMFGPRDESYRRPAPGPRPPNAAPGQPGQAGQPAARPPKAAPALVATPANPEPIAPTGGYIPEDQW